jgi:hypothetical protein
VTPSLWTLCLAALRCVLPVKPGAIVTYDEGAWIVLVADGYAGRARFVRKVSDSVSDHTVLEQLTREFAEWILTRPHDSTDERIVALRVALHGREVSR